MTNLTRKVVRQTSTRYAGMALVVELVPPAWVVVRKRGQRSTDGYSIDVASLYVLLAKVRAGGKGGKR